MVSKADAVPLRVDTLSLEKLSVFIFFVTKLIHVIGMEKRGWNVPFVVLGFLSGICSMVPIKRVALCGIFGMEPSVNGVSLADGVLLQCFNYQLLKVGLIFSSHK